LELDSCISGDEDIDLQQDFKEDAEEYIGRLSVRYLTSLGALPDEKLIPISALMAEGKDATLVLLDSMRYEDDVIDIPDCLLVIKSGRVTVDLHKQVTDYFPE